MRYIFLVSMIMIIETSLSFAADVQVSMDLNNKIFEIDKELDAKLQLFPEVENFITAILFRTENGKFYLEITNKIDKRINRTKRDFSPEEANEFRKKVTDLLEKNSNLKAVNHEGRVRFLIGTTLYGSYWGTTLPLALDFDGTTFMATYFFSVGGSFLIPYLATEDISVTDGMKNLSLGGGLMGFAHGALIYNTLFYDDFDYTSFNMVITLTSIGELIAGFKIASNNNFTAGKSAMITSLGMFGMGYGMSIGGIADFDDFETYCGLSLLTGGIGLYLGHYISENENITEGDVWIMEGAAELGFLTAGTMLIQIEPEDQETAFTFLTLGTLGGHFLGKYLIKDKNFTYAQGIYTDLAMVGGGAIGAGVGLLMSSNRMSQSDFKTMCLLTDVGAMIGYGLLYNSFSESASQSNEDTGSNFELKLRPEGLTDSYMLENNDYLEYKLNRSIFSRPYNPGKITTPILELIYRF